MITIVAALTIGYALRLGDHIIEVPISATRILPAGSQAAADSRIVETMMGAATGLLMGLAFARPRVQSAAEAMDELCRRMTELLALMAVGLRAGSVQESSEDWLTRARALRREIRRVDEALRDAEESVRLNPAA